MGIDLRLGTADAYVQENEGFDVAASTAASARFYFFASTNLTMADTNTFDILQWQSGAGTTEFSVNILDTSGVKSLRAGDTGGAVFRSSPLTLGVWHCIELSINTGSGANGTADFYLDGNQIGAQITTIASAALTQARLGSIGIDAGTTAGRLLFDEVIVDNARVFPFRQRYPRQIMLTQSGHVAVGMGRLSQVTLLSGGAADNEMSVYDDDTANTNDASNLIVPTLRNLNADIPESWEVEPQDGYFERGVYVTLSGTNPRALITIADSLLSVGAIASYAQRRPNYSAV